MIQTVSDLRRILDDCGDGVLLRVDGRPVRGAQVEGANPPTLVLVTDPAQEVGPTTAPLNPVPEPEDQPEPPADLVEEPDLFVDVPPPDEIPENDE